MKRLTYTEEQIIGVMKEAGASAMARSTASGATIYNWKAKYGGGLQVCEARRLRALEDENVKLKRLPAMRCWTTRA